MPLLLSQTRLVYRGFNVYYPYAFWKHPGTIPIYLKIRFIFWNVVWTEVELSNCTFAGGNNEGGVYLHCSSVGPGCADHTVALVWETQPLVSSIISLTVCQCVVLLFSDTYLLIWKSIKIVTNRDCTFAELGMKMLRIKVTAGSYTAQCTCRVKTL